MVFVQVSCSTEGFDSVFIDIPPNVEEIALFLRIYNLLDADK